jgi:uncharacterized membrane protein
MSETHHDNEPAHPPSTWTDEKVEGIIGNLLRIGVSVSALVVLLGGVLLMARDGLRPAEDRHEFKPIDLRSPATILHAVVALDSRGLIMLGLLMLIATPVARVIFSVFAFGRQRDFMYILITLIVLAVLFYSLFNG